MSTMSTIETMSEWHSSHAAALERCGLSARFERGDENDKPAAWVNVEGHGWIAQAITWESGEVELLARRESSEMLDVNEYYIVESAPELMKLLDGLTATIRGNTRPG